MAKLIRVNGFNKVINENQISSEVKVERSNKPKMSEARKAVINRRLSEHVRKLERRERIGRSIQETRLDTVKKAVREFGNKSTKVFEKKILIPHRSMHRRFSEAPVKSNDAKTNERKESAGVATEFEFAGWERKIKDLMLEWEDKFPKYSAKLSMILEYIEDREYAVALEMVNLLPWEIREEIPQRFIKFLDQRAKWALPENKMNELKMSSSDRIHFLQSGGSFDEKGNPIHTESAKIHLENLKFKRQINEASEENKNEFEGLSKKQLARLVKQRLSEYEQKYNSMSPAERKKEDRAIAKYLKELQKVFDVVEKIEFTERNVPLEEEPEFEPRRRSPRFDDTKEDRILRHNKFSRHGSAPRGTFKSEDTVRESRLENVRNLRENARK